MALTKLSITEKEAIQVKKLLAEGLSTHKIAIITGINQPKVWRNIKIMGLSVNVKIKKQVKSKYFNWTDYDNSIF